jgi:hypothetical protein
MKLELLLLLLLLMMMMTTGLFGKTCTILSQNPSAQHSKWSWRRDNNTKTECQSRKISSKEKYLLLSPLSLVGE